MDDFERKLQESLNCEVHIPQSVLDKAQLALEEIRSYQPQQPKKRFWLGKKQLAAAAVAVIVLGVAFNQPAIAAIKALLWGNHAGIEKAVDSGYVQNVPTSYTHSQGIGTRVTSVVIDKSRLALAIDVKFDDVSSVKNAADMFLDMVITNGKGNVIFGDGYPQQPVGAMEYTTDLSNKANGELIYNVLLQSPSSSIPQTNELMVKIKSIALFAQKNSTKPPFKKFAGPWNNNVTLDQHLAKAGGIAYTAKNDSPDITVTSAQLLPTGLAVKFIIGPAHGNDIETAEAQLVDSTGKTYQNSGVMSVDSIQDNKNLVSMVFEVSSFDKIDSFKLIVKYRNGKESIATLLRAGK